MGKASVKDIVKAVTPYWLNQLYLAWRSFRREGKSIQERFPYYRIGRGTFAGNMKVLHWGESATLKIGAFCSIADGVRIVLGGEHGTDRVTTYPFDVFRNMRDIAAELPGTKGNVVIGNDVWIGLDAMILSGVSVGNGAVIGASSVVASDVPPYSIVVGNPARVIKKRFDDVTIARLEQIQWWGRSDERIERALPFLLSNRIGDFIFAVEASKI